MTDSHCRIGRVKSKTGGADLYILPPTNKTTNLRYGDGELILRADKGDITQEHALFLLDVARHDLIGKTLGWKKD
jgi:hypothetical protein